MAHLYGELFPIRLVNADFMNLDDKVAVISEILEPFRP